MIATSAVSVRDTGRSRIMAALSGMFMLAALIIPLWIGPYPPLYDYPNHMLQAQIVVHYDDPAYTYSAGYLLKTGWQYDTNALVSLILIGMGQFMPVPLVGRLLVSLVAGLMFLGVVFLLPPGPSRALLWPLAAPLAYVAPFTSGWINFSLATALALFAVVAARYWRERGNRGALLGVALLSLLIYSAHFFAWVLAGLLIALQTGFSRTESRRAWVVLAAFCLVAPFAALSRPLLAAVAAAGIVSAWPVSAWLSRRTPPTWLIGITFAGAIVGVALFAGPLEDLRKIVLPGLRLRSDHKLSYLADTFLLPHQFLPPNAQLSLINLVFLISAVALIGVVAVAVIRSEPRRRPWPQFAPAGALLLLYIVIPSGTPDIQITEPRMLLFAVFAALAALDLPAHGRLHRTIAGLSAILALFTLTGVLVMSRDYAAQSQHLSRAMAQLEPARSLLVLQEAPTGMQPLVVGRQAHNNHYATTYTLERGGFNTRTFYNGPVRHRDELPIPAYWPQRTPEANAQFVAARCAELRVAYDGVIVWGAAPPALNNALNDCFQPISATENLSLWQP